MKCVTKSVRKSVKNKRLEDVPATEGSTKMDLKETGWGAEWFHLAQDRNSGGLL